MGHEERWDAQPEKELQCFPGCPAAVQPDDFLAQQLRDLRAALDPQCVLWISWPKKASKVTTTVSEDTIRELALPLAGHGIRQARIQYQTYSA